MKTIRMVTWLAPGLPLALFERIQETVACALSVSVLLEARTKLSGPQVGSSNPFADRMAEVGFLCAPAAVPERVRLSAGFELSGLAPLFDDIRYGGEPMCFCDIVVREAVKGYGLSPLRGMCFGYNDPSSLSGWLGLKAELGRRGLSEASFFDSVVRTGGHLESLKRLREGSIDSASVDSNVLRAHPAELKGLRVIESVGPWPSQPVVFRRCLADEMKARIRAALMRCGPWPEFGFVGFRGLDPRRLELVPSAAV